ncbi:DUF5305 family protein [Halorientalis regularis]|uniref:DUF5305 domain-containing protein n=1 Tax=Halorientalis regularis TaxID=660518 RepID=A0A1G7SGF0_9EURY|nr:DUF5305 family protein [Halorientalis regularis]SDG21290.1 hypothetical protein SAMN05216218_11832 [Halorientalis regularis]
MRTWGRRIRSTVDGQFGAVVFVLVATLLVGGWLTYGAYATTETTVEQEQRAQAQYVGAFDHEADVVVDSPVFDAGTTLSNRTAYFTQATPVLDGTFRYTYTATDGGNVSVTATVEAVFRSVADGEDGGEYWRVTRPLNRTTASIEPGETVRLSFSENVTELLNESQRYDESVGGTPGTLAVAFAADVTTEGTVNGRSVARSQTYRLGLSADDSVYRVDDPGTITNATKQTRAVRTQVQPGLVGRVGGPALLVVGLLGLLALGTLRYQGQLALSEAERAYMAYERDRNEYEEWITAARLPPEARDGPTVEVDSLEGLVDIAIDSDRRVIENGPDGEYVTVVDDVVYRFSAPPEPDSDPLSPLVSTNGASGDQGTDDWGDDEVADEEATASTDGND